MEISSGRAVVQWALCTATMGRAASLAPSATSGRAGFLGACWASYRKTSLTSAAAAATSEPLLSPAPALITPAVKNFIEVLDLTHATFEGFPAFDGAKWFTIEPLFRYVTRRIS